MIQGYDNHKVTKTRAIRESSGCLRIMRYAQNADHA